MFGTSAYDDLHEQAAALLHAIATNHPFADGNKRTASSPPPPSSPSTASTSPVSIRAWRTRWSSMSPPVTRGTSP
ncbi:Fic family protein [Streptomyces sp. NPDC057301]|uniref:Fic family protein n=1 Tax=Streptomyces sp. NPDC057301 TaxID=3346093 RepID=UPI003643C998